MKIKALTIGSLGETIARSYLKKKGYKIIEQNYKTKYAEIDIIAEHKKMCVFIEVKTKAGERFGTPEETLEQKKIHKLVKNAHAYTARKGYQGLYRIDAVCIVLDENGKPQRISHYQNITL